MNASTETEIKLELEGRTVFARLNPEDQAAIAELLARGSIVTIKQSDADTEGHMRYRAGDDNELFVDVEGHAMTLRLPTAGDAAALKRALAVTALTASVAVGGFAAGTYVQAQAQTAQPQSITIPMAPAAPNSQVTVAGDEGMADSAAQKASSEFAATGGPKTVVAPVQAPDTAPQAPGKNLHQGSRPE